VEKVAVVAVVEDVEMATASVVFKQDVDHEMMQDIVTLRSVRVALAERQLSDLDGTMNELVKRGLLGQREASSQRLSVASELQDKIQTLRERVGKSDVIFADELEFFLKVSRPQ
jgi:hypothetical protein